MTRTASQRSPCAVTLAARDFEIRSTTAGSSSSRTRQASDDADGHDQPARAGRDHGAGQTRPESTPA